MPSVQGSARADARYGMPRGGAAVLAAAVCGRIFAPNTLAGELTGGAAGEIVMGAGDALLGREALEGEGLSMRGWYSRGGTRYSRKPDMANPKKNRSSHLGDACTKHACGEA